MVFEGRKGFMAQWISVVMGHPTGWGSEAWKPGRSVDECEGPDRLIRGMSRGVITWRVCKFHHQDDRRFFWDLDPKYKPPWKPRLRGGGGSIPKCLRIWELTHGSWGPGRYQVILFHTKGTSSRVIGPKTNSSPLENMPDAPEVHLLIFYNFRGEYLTLLRTNSSPLPKLWRWIFIFSRWDMWSWFPSRVVFRGGMLKNPKNKKI